MDNQVVLVTGVTRGVGKAIALEFRQRNFVVIGCARKVKPTDFCEEIIPCDVTNEPQVKAMLESIHKKYGRLDCVVNNVGGGGKFGNLYDLGESDWEETYRLNVLSSLYVTRNAIPLLEKSQGPSVVNIASAVAMGPGKFYPHYGAAKAALLNLSKYMASELAPKKIRVNVVVPGVLAGDSWNDNVLNYSKSEKISLEQAQGDLTERQRAKIPLGRLGLESEVAKAVYFLASTESKWTTGSTFVIDGGMNPAL